MLIINKGNYYLLLLNTNFTNPHESFVLFVRFVVVFCTRLAKHSCNSCDSWSRKVLISIDLPEFSVSQGVDFFISEKNFILKRLGIKKNVYICTRNRRKTCRAIAESICTVRTVNSPNLYQGTRY